MMNVVDRLLAAMTAFYEAHPGRRPKVARVSPATALEIQEWMDTHPAQVDPTAETAYGMTIVKDEAVDDIVLEAA